MKNLKNNNKGFSLVELIVVIAIMVVLAVALAPVFTKFVEQSRAATDISNANTLAEAILVEVAENPNATAFSASSLPSTVKTWPTPTAKLAKNDDGSVKPFVAEYNSTENTVSVKVGSYNLVNPAHAEAYKNGTAAPTTP